MGLIVDGIKVPQLGDDSEKLHQMGFLINDNSESPTGRTEAPTPVEREPYLKRKPRPLHDDLRSS